MSYRVIKGFEAHCQNTASGCIDALDDVDLMEAILHTIGERHGRRGQDRQQFIVSSCDLLLPHSLVLFAYNIFNWKC